MRSLLALSLLFALAACAGDPRSYGITGPGAPPPPVTTDEDATSDMSAEPSTGTVHGPTMQPSTGGGRFWGYN